MAIREPKDNFALCKFMSDLLKKISEWSSTGTEMKRMIVSLMNTSKICLNELEVITIEFDGEQHQFKTYSEFESFAQNIIFKDKM
jgi:hypothetical protein